MSTLNTVELKFDINAAKSPIIKVSYDKNSDSIEQKLLGMLLSSSKSNNGQLIVEKTKDFSDGVELYEIKVLGT